MANAVQYIRQQITKEIIYDLLISNGASEIRDEGITFRSTCPIHGGDNPSAFVWDYTSGLWYCHTGCQTGGDIFSFIAHMYNLDQQSQFKSVIEKTAEVLHIDISNMELGERASAYRKEMIKWLEYMNRGKNKRTNQVFNIASLGTMYGINSYRNFTKETLGYFKARYIEEFNRLLIPIYDQNSVLIGATMRALDDNDKPKWLHRPKHIDTGNVLYNLNNLRESNVSVTIVEGCFDVWNLEQIAQENMLNHCCAVATFGAHLTEEQEALILERYTDVLLAYDNDKAGHDATRKAIKQLKYKVNLRVLDLTQRKDVGEIESLQEWLEIPILKWYEWIEKYGG